MKKVFRPHYEFILTMGTGWRSGTEIKGYSLEARTSLLASYRRTVFASYCLQREANVEAR